MNQTERNEYKAKITNSVKIAVEENLEGIKVTSVTDTVKGFVLETPVGYVEVSCVVKKATFDIDDAIAELSDKVANKEKRDKDRADKKAKDIAKKEKAKSTSWPYLTLKTN